MSHPRVGHVVCATASFCLAALTASSLASPARTGRAAQAGFAVVELFTSEGCSSCPPADTLLGELAAEATTKGLAIYPLAFHVDYWDQGGWKDPFSSPAYSRRQSAYARAAGSSQLYTPQMIVNGTAAFVGSDGQRAASAIRAALAHPALASVSLQVAAADRQPGDVSATARGATVTYSVTGAPRTAQLCVAAVESGLVSRVSGGENSGRVLRHQNVVRAFVTVALGGADRGTFAMPMPAGDTPRSLAIIAYVQDPATMAILGAAISR